MIPTSESKTHNIIVTVLYFLAIVWLAAVHRLSVMKDNGCCNAWKFGKWILIRSGSDIISWWETAQGRV